HSVTPSASSVFFSPIPPPPRSTLFPYTTLFRSHCVARDLRFGRFERPWRVMDLEPVRVERMIHGIQTVALGEEIFERAALRDSRSEEHTSELQSLAYLVCRLLLEKKKNIYSH